MPIAAYDPVTGAHLGTLRTLLSIFQDLAALSGGANSQQSRIWANFTALVANPAGGPNVPRWSLADGYGAPAVMALSVPAIDTPVSSAFPASVQNVARMKMVAAYLLGNPKYLEQPAFDPTINVKGYEGVPVAPPPP